MKIGVADYITKDTGVAHRYLTALSVESPEADAERMRILAEAAASNDRVALDRTLIDQLPQIVREAAAGLAGANVNVLNGADGLSEIAAGLVGQGLTILDSIKKNLATGPEATAAQATGQVVRVPDSQQDGQARG